MQIREEAMGPHMMKFHVEGLPFGAVFHRFTAPDSGDPHDHPWSFRSVILSGNYVEEVFSLDGECVNTIVRKTGDGHHVPADRIHRIIALPEGECWTLIIPEPGPPRTSGFYRWEGGRMLHRFWHETEFSDWPGHEPLRRAGPHDPPHGRN